MSRHIVGRTVPCGGRRTANIIMNTREQLIPTTYRIWSFQPRKEVKQPRAHMMEAKTQAKIHASVPEQEL